MVSKCFEDMIDGDFTTSNPLINQTWEPVYIMNKNYARTLWSFISDVIYKDAKKNINGGWQIGFGYEVLDKLNHETFKKCWYVNMDLLMNLI